MPGNPENLRGPFSPEEAREYGRMGGLAAAKKKKDKRSLRKALRELLEMPLPNDPDERSGMECLAVAMLDKALSGDIKAMTEIRDTIGEMPKHKATVSSAERFIFSWQGEDDQ